MGMSRPWRGSQKHPGLYKNLLLLARRPTRLARGLGLRRGGRLLLGRLRRGLLAGLEREVGEDRDRVGERGLEEALVDLDDRIGLRQNSLQRRQRVLALSSIRPR